MSADINKIVATPANNTQVYNNADDIIVDYLRDIRDQLIKLNKQLSRITERLPFDGRFMG